MPKISNAKLGTPNGRKGLKARGKPYWQVVADGISLGYRKTHSGIGTWTVRCLPLYDGEEEWTKRIGIADDVEDANGQTVLSFHQAAEVARALGRGGKVGEVSVSKVESVNDALDEYEDYLIRMGGNKANARRARAHVGALATKHVMLLTVKDLQGWQAGLLKRGMKPATANRVRNCLRAALTHAAKRDPRIINKHVWQDTELFESLPGATEARNVVLADDDVSRFVAAGYERSRKLGILMDVLSVTGARTSQAARIKVEGLHGADTAAPYLDMPRSAKGHKHKRASKAAETVQVPITRALAATLKAEAANRPANAPLLTRDNGLAWGLSDDYRRDVCDIVAKLGLESPDGEVTLYALRHSNITRMLKANVPVSIVAKIHDTSVREIERHYASKIANHADAIVRAALFHGVPADAGNVVQFAR